MSEVHRIEETSVQYDGRFPSFEAVCGEKYISPLGESRKEGTDNDLEVTCKPCLLILRQENILGDNHNQRAIAENNLLDDDDPKKKTINDLLNDGIISKLNLQLEHQGKKSGRHEYFNPQNKSCGHIGSRFGYEFDKLTKHAYSTDANPKISEIERRAELKKGSD